MITHISINKVTKYLGKHLGRKKHSDLGEHLGRKEALCINNRVDLLTMEAFASSLFNNVIATSLIIKSIIVVPV